MTVDESRQLSLPASGKSPPGKGQTQQAPPIERLGRLSRDFSSALAAARSLDTVLRKPGATLRELQLKLQQARAAAGKLPQETIGWLSNWLDSVAEDIETRQKSAASDFANDLEAELATEGIQLSGHLPLLRAAFFTLEVGAGEVRIWYGPQRESVSTIGVDACAVSDALQATIRELKKQPLESEKFLGLLHQSYLFATAGNAAGAQPRKAKIADVHLQMVLRMQPRSFISDPKRANLREYSRVQFSFDLYRLPERRWRGMELQLVTATKSQSLQRTDHLWVPSDQRGGGALYSDIVFRRTTDGGSV